VSLFFFFYQKQQQQQQRELRLLPVWELLRRALL
jgi:hypothetical protein